MYKVCILTAGRGTRNKYAKWVNKALLLVGGKFAISHIIDKFPKDIEIVIAVGHLAEQVEVFTRLLHPERKITFVNVEYTGIGRGPGFSLLSCKGYLQCPFVYSACDTIVKENIPKPDKNWMGVASVGERIPYLTLDIKDGLVNKVYDKEDENATYIASIGLVGVNDYKSFWEGLANPTLVQNEHQDTSGLNALIPHKLHAVNFTWFDTGSMEGYEYANRHFGKSISG